MTDATKQASETTASGEVEDLLLDHQYDGIQEYDNPMPRWWVWIFWGTFWFALAYIFHFWIGNGVSIAEAYQAEATAVGEARAAEALKETVSEDSLAKMMADPATVDAGAAVFASRCVPCHQEKGQGAIGPNLTDNYWIHGKGQLLDIYKTVSEGVPAKGMPPWGKQLSPAEVRSVVSFVGSIRGTNVEGKAPEGEPVN